MRQGCVGLRSLSCTRGWDFRASGLVRFHNEEPQTLKHKFRGQGVYGRSALLSKARTSGHFMFAPVGLSR